MLGDSETPKEAPRKSMHYVGLDVHKKTISYCVNDSSGQLPLGSDGDGNLDLSNNLRHSLAANNRTTALNVHPDRTHLMASQIACRQNQSLTPQGAPH